ncbi:rRNA maturation RNase YbeY [Teichococcus vastitatis]|uniref:Endoribonuclease YbeY n=1 Tax=Teichococcus vastitatis TaxID=2307076 RepID=A0ABS9W7N3_9PROT|nr:rRNA maturation RNase YbeY [Pseudoroseomonas vastitatis]MCI0755233.1 rRNA maturation RNase YbeY [Pseudoroseomonas vastitatis]
MEPGSSRPGHGDVVGQSTPEVVVLIDAPAWRAAVPRAESLARRAAEAAWAEMAGDGFLRGPHGDAAPVGAPAGGMTVLLTDDRAVKRLNADHRGKNKPTNVLSFPGEGFGHLGDVALGLGVVRREARDAGRKVATHLAHLVAHGTLHLGGHDHIAAGEARRMERAEARIMRRLGLPNPWRGVS